MIKLGNLHSTSLYNKTRLWWLGFVVCHRMLWGCFKGGYLHVDVVLIQTVQGQAQRF